MIQICLNRSEWALQWEENKRILSGKKELCHSLTRKAYLFLMVHKIMIHLKSVAS